ncbi:MAG: hypothetical protein AAFX95_22160 [Cyanobacteria bacterium J06639_16]
MIKIADDGLSRSHKALCTTANQKIACVLSTPAVLGALSNLASDIT